MDFIESCRKFISFDSTPSHGNYELAVFAAELCRQQGLHVEIQEEYQGDLRQANIMARPVSERPGAELMLQTHLDTCDPGPYGLWKMTSQNPFDAHIIESKIYGLGAADAKLDFLCKLGAMVQLKDRKTWSLPPVLVGTYGEESGMSGSLKMIRKNKVCAKMALVGEPSDLRLLTAGKGMAIVEIRVPYSEQELNYKREHNLKESTATQSRVFHGKAAHSSAPHLGESAIRKMFETLLQLPESLVIMEMDGGVNYNTVPANAFLEIDPISGIQKPVSKRLVTIYQAIKKLEKDFERFQDPDFSPPQPTLNIGFVRTFDDHILITGSCRIPPSVPMDVYEGWMEELRQTARQVDSEFKVTDYKKPYRTELPSRLVRGCMAELESMGLSSQPSGQSNTNEASLWTRVGIECVSFGAGARDANIHTPQEHVSIEDLKKSTEFYRRIIERFCL